MIGKTKQPARLRETLDDGAALARGLREARARHPADVAVADAERRLFAVLETAALASGPAQAPPGQSGPGVSGAAKLAGGSAGVAWKVTLALAIGAATTTAAAHFLRRPHDRAVHPAAALVAAPAIPAVSPAPPAVATADSSPPPSAVEAAGTTHRPAARRGHPPATARIDRLARELRLIEPARAALITDPDRALALCAQHQREFPDGGVMTEEREFIAISALARIARGDEARMRAAAFEERFPASPYRERLRTRLLRQDR